MPQVARNLTDSESGTLGHQRFVLQDRDTKFCSGFKSILLASGLPPLRLPARSPNRNALAARWVRSVKQECLSKLILFSEASLKTVLADYLTHDHAERNHQGKHNLLLFPARADTSPPANPIVGKQRLGGLLQYYTKAA
jgi:putative transposase